MFETRTSNDKFLIILEEGLQFSIEHSTPIIKFSNTLTQVMFHKHNILINSKFHRTSFTPSLIISRKNINKILDKFINSFKDASKIF